jgi:succinate-semialdehyde dehydrogenase / glutarate-semialdehyde dehydrogenase
MTSHASTTSSTTVAAAALPAQRDLQRLSQMVTTAGSRPQIRVVSPLTGALVGEVPACTSEDVQSAFERGRAAQAAWAALPIKERVKPFLAAHDRFLNARFELADLIQLENGKARLNALEEPYEVALNLRYYGYHSTSFLGPKQKRGAMPLFTRTFEVRHPWGVVGLITPWNYPLNLAISDAVAALIAGNAVVLKPSELTPFSVLAGIEMLRGAGLPDDLFQVVTGDGETTGAAVVERADYVMFTGSTAVGRRIAEQCGRRLISCSLELGGKNPAVVLEDADLERAVASVTDGALAGSGQTCVSFERLYVHDAIYDRFVPMIAERFKAIELSTSMMALGGRMGTLTSAAQLAKVRGHVEDAVSKGARVLAGGKARPDIGPYFFELTLLEGVTPEMALYAEETFGPVVSVYRVKSDDEAVAACNEPAYGLNASVYSRDIKRAKRLATRIEAGTVGVNENYKVIWASLDAPQGGFKQSGFGRRHGREGITKYTQTQQISVQNILPLTPSKYLRAGRWVQFFNIVLRLMRHTPGLR